MNHEELKKRAAKMARKALENGDVDTAVAISELLHVLETTEDALHDELLSAETRLARAKEHNRKLIESLYREK